MCENLQNTKPGLYSSQPRFHASQPCSKDLPQSKHLLAIFEHRLTTFHFFPLFFPEKSVFKVPFKRILRECIVIENCPLAMEVFEDIVKKDTPSVDVGAFCLMLINIGQLQHFDAYLHVSEGEGLDSCLSMYRWSGMTESVYRIYNLCCSIF